MTILYLVPSIMYLDQIFYILGIFASWQRIVARTCMLFGGGGLKLLNICFFVMNHLHTIQFIFLHAGSLGQLHTDNSHACCGIILVAPSATPCHVVHTVR